MIALVDLDSSSVLDLKHRAFPDHTLDLNMQFLNMHLAELHSPCIPLTMELK